MLKITTLDVGDGDSIVLEHVDEGRSRFAVIDSNRLSVHTPSPALAYLLSKQVTSLSFVALTHPHRDHLNGLDELIEHYKQNIGMAFTYSIPIDPSRQRMLSEQLIKVIEESDGLERTFAASFLRVCKGIKTYIPPEDWEFVDGTSSELKCDDFTNGKFKITSILPAKSMKGSYFDDVDKNSIKFSDPRQNDLSFALHIEYAGVNVILGGDASLKSWRVRMRKFKNALNAQVAKLPHHGALDDCSKEVLEHIYGPHQEGGHQFALISADGSRHPHKDVLKLLKKMGIKPYCTSRATECGATPVRDLITSHSIDSALTKDVNSRAVAVTKNGPCQGSITVEIDPQGNTAVHPTFNTPCGFR